MCIRDRLKGGGGGGTRKTLGIIELPTGAYEIGDIETYLKKALVDPKFSLRANNNTLKCELYCSYEIDFGRTEHGIIPCWVSSRTASYKRINYTRGRARKH